MKTIALGAMLALGLVVSAAGTPARAAGDGLDRNAGAQGNGRTGRMVTGARQDSRAAMRASKSRRMMRR